MQPWFLQKWVRYVLFVYGLFLWSQVLRACYRRRLMISCSSWKQCSGKFLVLILLLLIFIFMYNRDIVQIKWEEGSRINIWLMLVLNLLVFSKTIANFKKIWHVFSKITRLFSADTIKSHYYLVRFQPFYQNIECAGSIVDFWSWPVHHF